MLYLIKNTLRNLFLPRHDLFLENLALRQQLLVLQRQIKKPELRDRDRAFWVVLSRLWPGWKNPLLVVKPQTVIAWHRFLWRKYWKRKSRPKDKGRPRIPEEVIELIRRISIQNPNWGALRIQGELIMLGHYHSPATIAKYMVRRRGRPNQNWKTFIRNHLNEISAIDFLTVPTVTFKTLYIFIVLSLDRRRVVHFHVTNHPTADWTALQLIQAFPFDTAPNILIRDRDQIYGEEVLNTIDNLGMDDWPTSPRSPWQNGYCERMVGTLKRECLHHMILFSEGHARRVLKKFFQYYHDDRTHLGLAKATPGGREIEGPELGPVMRRPAVNGLHSRYYRQAA